MRIALLVTSTSVALGLTMPAMAAPSPPPVPASVKSHTAPYPTFGSIERLDPAMDVLVPKDAALEALAEGFEWSEGPVWIEKNGRLLFSDIPVNTIYAWKDGAGISVFMRPAGYHGARTDLNEPGSNGLALDPRGRLVMCQHGNRRLATLASWSKPQGKQLALAERFEGKRFNSPNDLVFSRTGELFFTDPPYGLAKNVDDPEKELPFQGVFRLDRKGKVHLVSSALERPNGIALSPDEATLYVANSHGPRPIIMAFSRGKGGSFGDGRVFFDGTALARDPARKGAFDGMAIDRQGNVWATGPGGVLVLSKEGKHLGTLLTGQATANCKFEQTGKTLYITADGILARLRLPR